jgi:nitrogen fixation protein FixH
MSVAVTYASTVTTVETLATNVPAASSNGKAVTHNGYNSSQSLTGTTAVPVTKCAYFSKALSSGAGTIDLTALTGTNGATVDLTGLKVQVAKFKNPAANANPITVTFGASNAYLLGGSAFKWILSPGQEITIFGNDAAPDVSSTAKNIDISGTGAQALECSIVAG